MVTGLFKNKVKDSSLYEEGEIGGAGEGGEGHGGLRESTQELLFRALCSASVTVVHYAVCSVVHCPSKYFQHLLCTRHFILFTKHCFVMSVSSNSCNNSWVGPMNGRGYSQNIGFFTY